MHPISSQRTAPFNATPAVLPLSELLTPKQMEARSLLFGPARHIMLYGGSRSGKSFAICYAVLKRAFAAPGSRHCIARFRFNHAKRSIALDTMPKVIKTMFPGAAIKLDKTDWYWKLPNGSEIWLAGLDDKERSEKILGMEFATIFLNECSQIGHHAVRLMRTRLAQRVELDKTLHKQGGFLPMRMFYDQNPPSMAHWSYAEFISNINPVDKKPLPEGLYSGLVMNPADNLKNIAPEYLAELELLPLKDRLRFLEGKFQAEDNMMLWAYSSILRADSTDDDCEQVVVGVDPSGKETGDEVGIVGAGRVASKYFVIEDRSLQGKPDVWARTAIELHDDLMADCIVAERNFGGDMVANTIEHVARDMWRRGERKNEFIKVEDVVSSRGKVLRAEPISGLYSRQLVYHLGTFNDLEDEMTQFSTAWDRKTHGSPNRVDALVFAIQKLMDGQPSSRPVVFGTA